MKTSRLLIIDNLIIQPLIVLLNVFVILLGKLLRIDHQLKGTQFKKIAICKYKGLGSIIQATPLLETLRKEYPNAEISFISSAANRDFLAKIDSIDNRVLLNDPSFFKLFFNLPIFIFKLFRARYDVYIDLEVYSNFSSLMTIFSAAKNRIGFYLQSKNYRMGNYTHMMYYNTRSSISQTYLQFARLLGCKNIQTDIVRINSESEKIRLTTETVDLKHSSYYVVNPNASDLRYERRWGQEKNIELIKNLLTKFPKKKIVLIGSKSEQKYVSGISSSIASDRLLNLSGKTNIEELIAIINNAELMITNDSGPMHIAFACRTRTIALFGPCAPEQYGYHPKSVSLYSRAYCSPCVHDFVNPPCRGNNICMQSISVEDVLNTILTFDDKLIQQTNNSQDLGIKYTKDEFIFGAFTRKKSNIK